MSNTGLDRTAGPLGDILDLDYSSSAISAIGVLTSSLVSGTNYYLSGSYSGAAFSSNASSLFIER
jgi:hypothetical protein